MAVDPNIYALSIQLQLDAGDAFDTLDQFGDSITAVEDQISDAAQAAMQSITDVASSVDKSLGDVLQSTKDINTSSLDIGNALQQIISHVDDWGDLTPDELENFKNILDVAEDLVKTLEDKNLVHKDEIKHVEDEQDLIDQLAEQWSDVTEGIRMSFYATKLLIGVFTSLVETIARASDIQEKFVENNYRLYGSMDGIAAEVRGIGREYGVLEKEALEAYKALADVRTPRDEIAKMTTNLVQMNRVTGVGMQTLAEYTKQLRAVGGTAATTELHLNRMQDMMRKAGLSAEQMNNILGNSEISMKQLTIMFGSREGAEYFQETKIAAAGMAQQLGYNADAASKQLDMLATDIETVALMAGRAGMEIPKTAEETEQVFIAASIAASKELEAIEQSNLGLAEKQARMEALRESYGFHNQQALEASAAIGKEIERRRANGEAIGDLTDLYSKLQTEMEASFDATQRLSRSWEDLKEATSGVFREFFNLIGIILVPMIKWLTRLMNAVAAVIGFFVDLYDAARNLPILGWLIQWGEEIVGLMLAVAFVVGVVVVAMMGFGAVASVVSTAWAGASSVFSNIGNVLANVAHGIGRAIVTVFQSIGQGLAALGRAVAPVMVPLLALGAALMLAGIGAYFLSMAMVQLASLGWGEFFASLIMVTLAIGLLGLVLVGLAYLAMPVIPALLAIGLVMLMIGVAALAMGAGLYLSAMAFQMIVDAIGPQSPPLWVKLPLVAAGLLMVAAATYFAAPALLILAGILLVVAVAAWILAPAFTAIVTALQGLDAAIVMETAQGLVTGSMLFLEAALILFAAAVIMIPAVIGITLATMMLAATMTLVMLASTMMMIAGPMLVAGAISFKFGAWWLGGAAETIYENGMLIGMGGAALLAGTIAVLRAAALIGQSGSALYDAASIMSEAIVALEIVDTLYNISIKMVMAGGWLMAGGMALWVGAKLVVAASTILVAGAGVIMAAAILMLPASILLIYVGMNLLVAGSLMFRGALAIIVATAMLYMAAYGMMFLGPLLAFVGIEMIIGSTMVYIASVILFTASIILTRASIIMAFATTNILYSTALLFVSGAALMVAGPMLAMGALQVMNASWMLIGAAMMLTLAGRWLVPAAMAIWSGMWWLDIAMMRFKNTIQVIEKVGNAVFLLATSLDMMRNAPFDSLQSVAKDALASLPMLDKFAARLPAVAARMHEATAKFKKPADELAKVLHNLGDAILKFDGVGQSLAEDMESVAEVLDKYAYRLEAASQRIQTAVDTKATPAMAAAEDSGVAEAVRSEAITQVQVTTSTEGSEEAQDTQTEMLARQVAALESLDEKLSMMVAAGPGGDVGEILALLSSYLPEMATRRGGLSSEMNSWMK